ncbi:MAG: RICIN domain-containing protein, partial [Pseudomonadota bacterium]
IRRVAAGTEIIGTIAGGATAGFSGDGGPATAALLRNPIGVALDSADDVYIADTANFRIRKITAGTGVINTIAGTGTSGIAGDGGPATSAKIGTVFSVVTDAAKKSDLVGHRKRPGAAGGGWDGSDFADGRRGRSRLQS